MRKKHFTIPPPPREEQSQSMPRKLKPGNAAAGLRPWTASECDKSRAREVAPRTPLGRPTSLVAKRHASRAKKEVWLRTSDEVAPVGAPPPKLPRRQRRPHLPTLARNVTAAEKGHPDPHDPR
jgi:hypothetical protein